MQTPQFSSSPQALSLKSALDATDSAVNVQQALYDWLSSLGISSVSVDRVLRLTSLDASYDALMGLVWSKLGVGKSSEDVAKLVRAALLKIAQKHVVHMTQTESARRIVRLLLDS